MLRNRYSAPEWALLFEVRNGTGAGANRSADALAMNLWPSRGMELHGFEVKVSRGDLLAELRAPEKSDAVQRYCDRWWLVVGEKDLVKPGELPAAWGLLAPLGNYLRAFVEAPKLEPAAVDRRFLSALLRNAVENLTDKKEIDAMVRARLEELRKSDRRVLDQRKKDAVWHDGQLEKSLRAFEEKSGISIGAYDGERIGALVQVVRASRPEQIVQSAEYFAERLEKMLVDVRHYLAECQKPEKDFNAARPNSPAAASTSAAASEGAATQRKAVEA